MNTLEHETSVPRRLVLVRHGRTAENAAGRFLGRNDPDLDDLGTQQARTAASVLASLDGFEVVSSPARRAVQTAQLLGITEPRLEERFREIDFGEWEGSTQEEAARSHPDEFAAFDRGAIPGFPGGETIAAVAERTRAAVESSPHSRLLVVTHATVIRILVASLLNFDVAEYRAAFGRPDHLSWTELERHDRGWRLLTYADHRPLGVGASSSDLAQ